MRILIFGTAVIAIGMLIQWICRMIAGNEISWKYIALFGGVMFASGILSVILKSAFSSKKQQNAIAYFGGMFCRMILTMVVAIVILLTHEKSDANRLLLALAAFYLAMLPIEVWAIVR
ncbi:MAG: hypothetical protein LBT05_12635 [Planctomycetaceae bacterium]|jgi:predicted permease|nr:hypothetical protein [Planctomycetaceae bacterium]